MLLHHIQPAAWLLFGYLSTSGDASPLGGLLGFHPIQPDQDLILRDESAYDSGNSTSRISRRDISSDQSCPDGFLCNQQACSPEIYCPAGTLCVDFEGTPACADSDLSFCALNPNTFEAVGCSNGDICCHGNCYQPGTVCCNFDEISCDVGLANCALAREPGSTCNLTPLPGWAFTDNEGILAVEAAAPIWWQATSSCLASAAEDGQGHQTNGVMVPVVECGINQQINNGCPPQPDWTGPHTPYVNIPGEPFANIPTYYRTVFCTNDQTWRIYYGVYFKHDVSHESDWEWMIAIFKTIGNDVWTRRGILMESDGDYGTGYWNSIPNTFNDDGDRETDGLMGLDHPKIYFSKRHHSVHFDANSENKDTCIAPDFRADDFEFYALENLRSANDVIPSSWTYGRATNPSDLDVCNNRNQDAFVATL